MHVQVVAQNPHSCQAQRVVLSWPPPTHQEHQHRRTFCATQSTQRFCEHMSTFSVQFAKGSILSRSTALPAAVWCEQAYHRHKRARSHRRTCIAYHQDTHSDGQAPILAAWPHFVHAVSGRHYQRARAEINEQFSATQYSVSSVCSLPAVLLLWRHLRGRPQATAHRISTPHLRQPCLLMRASRPAFVSLMLHRVWRP